MEQVSVSETTRLLRDWATGDERALLQLMPRVYRELRRLAGRMLQNEKPGQSMQASDLVHEVYLRLVDVRELDWRHRAQFFAIAATMMRRIVLDRARRRVAQKRGGKPAQLDLEEGLTLSLDRSREVIALDDALKALAEMDPRKARIVELRFYVGLSVEETAAVVKVSPQTVLRDWKLARKWLWKEVRGGS